MKKMIYTAAVLMCAVVMAACGGQSNVTFVKGNKSQMDSLSYAFGVNIGSGIIYDMPELKLDWTLMNDAMEKQLLEEIVAEDPQQEEARTKLEAFFSGPRIERMNAKAAELMAADSTRQLVREDFVEFDVFQGDEAQRKEISEAYGTYMGVNIRSSRLPLQTYWLKKGIEEYAAGEATIDEGLAQAIIQVSITTISLSMANTYGKPLNAVVGSVLPKPKSHSYGSSVATTTTKILNSIKNNNKKWKKQFKRLPMAIKEVTYEKLLQISPRCRYYHRFLCCLRT